MNPMGKLIRAWAETPWGKLWAAALIIMIGAFIGPLLDGFPIRSAAIFGVLCGPGFLAFVTIASLVMAYVWPELE